MSVSQDGAELHWDRESLPIRVIVHPSALRWKLAFHEAVELWNARMGFTLFTISADLHPEAVAFLHNSPGVVPVMGVECFDWFFCPNPLTYQIHNRMTGEITSAPIFVPTFEEAQKEIPEMTWAAMHELGHAVGLDHDSVGSGSLMEPSITKNPRPPVTEYDAQTLRRFYGPQAQ